MDGPSELTIQDVKDRHKSQGKKCIYIFVFTFPNNWKPQNRTGEERKKERKKEKKRNRKGKKNNNNNKTTRKETPEAGCRKPDGIDQSESKPLAWFLKQFFFLGIFTGSSHLFRFNNEFVVGMLCDLSEDSRGHDCRDADYPTILGRTLESDPLRCFEMYQFWTRTWLFISNFLIILTVGILEWHCSFKQFEGQPW